MVKSLKFFHNVWVITLIGICSSCSNDIIYKREYSNEEKEKLSLSLLEACGTDRYYQGTIAERMLILESKKYNDASAWAEREWGVPYLKRGYASEANEFYSSAVKYDKKEWLGYKAYCWLYFYRDYSTALREIEEYDDFTPGFIDYPQSTSVLFIQGICHLKLGDPEKALYFFKLHFEEEKKNVGENYINAVVYVLLGECYYQLKDYTTAIQWYKKGIKYNESTSDLHYYLGRAYYDNNQNSEAILALEDANNWFSKGAKNTRPYVEEFYAIYQEDIDMLQKKLGSE